MLEIVWIYANASNAYWNIIYGNIDGREPEG